VVTNDPYGSLARNLHMYVRFQHNLRTKTSFHIIRIAEDLNHNSRTKTSLHTITIAEDLYRTIHIYDT